MSELTWDDYLSEQSRKCAKLARLRNGEDGWCRVAMRMPAGYFEIDTRTSKQVYTAHIVSGSGLYFYEGAVHLYQSGTEIRVGSKQVFYVRKVYQNTLMIMRTPPALRGVPT